jgi:hypothetical protein
MFDSDMILEGCGVDESLLQAYLALKGDEKSINQMFDQLNILPTIFFQSKKAQTFIVKENIYNLENSHLYNRKDLHIKLLTLPDTFGNLRSTYRYIPYIIK